MASLRAPSPRPPIDGGTVLITGASSGIGLELAGELAPRARALVLVARRAERLEGLKDELSAKYPALVVRTEPCDLSDPDAVDELSGRLLEDFGAVDVLVNNAGAGLEGLYEESDWARVHRLIQLNVVALALLTRRLTPGMVVRRRGGVLNINSGAGTMRRAVTSDSNPRTTRAVSSFTSLIPTSSSPAFSRLREWPRCWI